MPWYLVALAVTLCVYALYRILPGDQAGPNDPEPDDLGAQEKLDRWERIREAGLIHEPPAEDFSQGQPWCPPPGQPYGPYGTTSAGHAQPLTPVTLQHRPIETMAVPPPLVIEKHPLAPPLSLGSAVRVHPDRRSGEIPGSLGPAVITPKAKRAKTAKSAKKKAPVSEQKSARTRLPRAR